MIPLLRQSARRRINRLWTTSDIEEQLAKASNAFVDWRYIYESKLPKGLNVLFLAKFARAIAEQLEVIRGHGLTLHLNMPPALPRGAT